MWETKLRLPMRKIKLLMSPRKKCLHRWPWSFPQGYSSNLISQLCKLGTSWSSGCRSSPPSWYPSQCSWCMQNFWRESISRMARLASAASRLSLISRSTRLYLTLPMDVTRDWKTSSTILTSTALIRRALVTSRQPPSWIAPLRPSFRMALHRRQEIKATQTTFPVA